LRQRRFHFRNGLALFLCVALAVIWVRSHWYVDQIVSGFGTHRWLIILNSGVLQVGRSQANATPPGSKWYIFSVGEYPANTSRFFYFVKAAGTGWAFGIPMRFFVIASLLWFSIEWHRSRSYPPGFCSHCGYDLRATPYRCPECGAAAG
jgi:hypothetical protein